MMCEHGYTIDCAQCLKAQVERLENIERLAVAVIGSRFVADSSDIGVISSVGDDELMALMAALEGKQE